MDQLIYSLIEDKFIQIPGAQPATADPHVVLSVLSIAPPMEILPIMSSNKHKIFGWFIELGPYEVL